jgi:hypothetical protein
MGDKENVRCLVAIDLKMTEFMPEYTGKMNFYLSALDDMVRHPDDQSSVGIILCKSKSGLVAEYSLWDGETPSVYPNTGSPPDCPMGSAVSCPSPQELAGVLEEVDGENGG